MTDIDWSKNCITAGVHNGDGGLEFRTSLSDIDLSDETIYSMVEKKVKDDAQQYVDHAGFTQEWADLIVALWEGPFEDALKDARENGVRWQRELKDTEELYGKERRDRYQEKRNATVNSSWNDHVTYICRVCGTSAARRAYSVLVEEQGKSIKQDGS